MFSLQTSEHLQIMCKKINFSDRMQSQIGLGTLGGYNKITFSLQTSAHLNETGFRLPSIAFPALHFLHRISSIAFPALHFLHYISSIAFPALHFQHCISSIAFLASPSQRCISCIAFLALHFQHCISSIAFPALHFQHCQLCISGIAFLASPSQHLKVFGFRRASTRSKQSCLNSLSVLQI